MRLLTKRKYLYLAVFLLLAFPAAALAATGTVGGGSKGPSVAQARALTMRPLQRSVVEYRHVVLTVGQEIEAERREERRRSVRERFATLPGGVSIGTLESIAACESGGDPKVVSSDGTYRGKYQFDYGTWESVGGHGDPAAASEQEQDYRAALLYARSGSSPWPVCG